MVVFAFGQMQKADLHNLFADHKDFKHEKNHEGSGPHFHAGGHCYIENIVAESQFVNDPSQLAFPILACYSLFIPSEQPFTSLSKVFSPLRGPPVILG